MPTDRTSPSAPAQRGVSVPFTTPLLCGARVRARSPRGLEILLPNPSGAKGVYIVDPSTLYDLCCPTLHDHMLLEHLAEAPRLDHTTVRELSRRVALSGAAGREAAEAAKRAHETEATVALLARYLLLVRLLDAVGVQNLAPGTNDLGDEAWRAKTRRRLERFAREQRIRPEGLFAFVDEIAAYAASLGFRTGEFEARHQQTLRRLEGFAFSVERWASVEGNEVAQRAAKVASAARSTHKAARTALERAQQMLEDMVELLRAWRDDRVALFASLSTCERVLDGWAEICQLWETTGDSRALQRVALGQIENFLQVAAVAAGALPDAAEEPAAPPREGAPATEDWRAELARSEWVERRERLRAGAPA